MTLVTMDYKKVKPNEKLIECPLCHAKKRLYVYKDKWGYFVMCENCGCNTGYYDFKKTAVYIWNHRSDAE